MSQATALDGGTPTPDSGLALRRNVALVMLFVVGTINFVDRQLLSVLVEPIRAEMDFSDTQFGLLTGLAFALFYAAMGVPVAMVADRWNRIKLIGIACVVWSGFTAACGLASNFWQLALMRFGVGAGEAGGTAPSLSVLADYYPPAQRPLAIGIFTLNGPFGVFVGAAFGAWAAANIGWRNAFVVIGIVGILVAPLLIWLVREPARGAMDTHKPADEALPFSQSLAMFIRRPSLRMVMIGSGLAAFVSYGMLNWIPAFLMRTQKMPLEAMATWFAPAAGITFGIGILGGGACLWHDPRACDGGADPDLHRRAARRHMAALTRADAGPDGGMHRLCRPRPRAGAEPHPTTQPRDRRRGADADVQHCRPRAWPAVRRNRQRRAEGHARRR